MGLVKTLKKAYVYASTKNAKEAFTDGTGVLISSLENAGAKIDNGLEKAFPYASHTNVKDALKDSGAYLGNAYNRAISSFENAGAWVEQNLQKVALAGLIAGTAFAYSAPKIAYAEAPKNPPKAVNSHVYYQMDLKGKSLEEQLGKILSKENAKKTSALSSETRKIQEKSYPSEKYGDKSTFFSGKYAEKNQIDTHTLTQWTSTRYSDGTRKYRKQEPNFISQAREAGEKYSNSSTDYLDVKRKMANTSKKTAEFGLGAMGVLGLGLLGVYGYKTIKQHRKSRLSKNNKGDAGNGDGGTKSNKTIEIKPKKPTYSPSESLEAELKGSGKQNLLKSVVERISYFLAKKNDDKNSGNGNDKDKKQVVVLDDGSFFYLPEQHGGGPNDDNKGPKGGMKPQKQASIDDTVDNVPGKTTSQENNGSSTGFMYDRFYARIARKDGYLDTIAEELIQRYNCSDAEGKRLYKVRDIADEFRMSKGQLYRILNSNNDKVKKRSPRKVNKKEAENKAGKVISFAEAKRRKQEKKEAHDLDEGKDCLLGRR